MRPSCTLQSRFLVVKSPINKIVRTLLPLARANNIVKRYRISGVRFLIALSRLELPRSRKFRSMHLVLKLVDSKEGRCNFGETALHAINV